MASATATEESIPEDLASATITRESMTEEGSTTTTIGESTTIITLESSSTTTVGCSMACINGGVCVPENNACSCPENYSGATCDEQISMFVIGA